MSTDTTVVTASKTCQYILQVGHRKGYKCNHDTSRDYCEIHTILYDDKDVEIQHFHDNNLDNLLRNYNSSEYKTINHKTIVENRGLCCIIKHDDGTVCHDTTGTSWIVPMCVVCRNMCTTKTTMAAGLCPLRDDNGMMCGRRLGSNNKCDIHGVVSEILDSTVKCINVKYDGKICGSILTTTEEVPLCITCRKNISLDTMFSMGRCTHLCSDERILGIMCGKKCNKDRGGSLYHCPTHHKLFTDGMKTSTRIIVSATFVVTCINSKQDGSLCGVEVKATDAKEVPLCSHCRYTASIGDMVSIFRCCYRLTTGPPGGIMCGHKIGDSDMDNDIFECFCTKHRLTDEPVSYCTFATDNGKKCGKTSPYRDYHYCREHNPYLNMTVKNPELKGKCSAIISHNEMGTLRCHNASLSDNVWCNQCIAANTPTTFKIQNVERAKKRDENVVKHDTSIVTSTASSSTTTTVTSSTSATPNSVLHTGPLSITNLFAMGGECL